MWTPLKSGYKYRRGRRVWRVKEPQAPTSSAVDAGVGVVVPEAVQPASASDGSGIGVVVPEYYLADLKKAHTEFHRPLLMAAEQELVACQAPTPVVFATRQLLNRPKASTSSAVDAGVGVVVPEASHSMANPVEQPQACQDDSQAWFRDGPPDVYMEAFKASKQQRLSMLSQQSTEAADDSDDCDDSDFELATARRIAGIDDKESSSLELPEVAAAAQRDNVDQIARVTVVLEVNGTPGQQRLHEQQFAQSALDRAIAKKPVEAAMSAAILEAIPKFAIGDIVKHQSRAKSDAVVIGTYLEHAEVAFFDPDRSMAWLGDTAAWYKDLQRGTETFRLNSPVRLECTGKLASFHGTKGKVSRQVKREHRNGRTVLTVTVKLESGKEHVFNLHNVKSLAEEEKKKMQEHVDLCAKLIAEMQISQDAVDAVVDVEKDTIADVEMGEAPATDGRGEAAKEEAIVANERASPVEATMLTTTGTTVGGSSEAWSWFHQPTSHSWVGNSLAFLCCVGSRKRCQQIRLEYVVVGEVGDPLLLAAAFLANLQRHAYTGFFLAESCVQLRKEQDFNRMSQRRIEEMAVEIEALKKSLGLEAASKEKMIEAILAQEATLTKAIFNTVQEAGDVRRGQRLNLKLKVVKCVSIAENSWEAVLGDVTGVITFVLTDRAHADLCQPGNFVRVQNAELIVRGGHKKVAIDKWAVFTAADESIEGDVLESNDVSAREQEVTQKAAEKRVIEGHPYLKQEMIERWGNDEGTRKWDSAPKVETWRKREYREMQNKESEKRSQQYSNNAKAGWHSEASRSRRKDRKEKLEHSYWRPVAADEAGDKASRSRRKDRKEAVAADEAGDKVTMSPIATSKKNLEAIFGAASSTVAASTPV